MTDAPPRRRRRWERLDHDARRAQILLCARRLYTQRSYSAVSMEEIARTAGVRRGLLHHYFGNKRVLYVEVVRDMLASYGRSLLPLQKVEGPTEVVVAAHVDHWLDAIEADAESWFAIVGAEGFGRDPDVERLVERARDASVEAIIAALDLTDAGDELRVVLRGYSGLADVVTREWLQRSTIDRAQTHALLATALVSLVREAVPAVQGAS